MSYEEPDNTMLEWSNQQSPVPAQKQHMVLLCTKYTKFQCLPGLATTIQAVTWQQVNGN